MREAKLLNTFPIRQLHIPIMYTDYRVRTEYPPPPGGCSICRVCLFLLPGWSRGSVGCSEDQGLNGPHTIGLVTDHPRHRHLADLLQLAWRREKKSMEVSWSSCPFFFEEDVITLQLCLRAETSFWWVITFPGQKYVEIYPQSEESCVTWYIEGDRAASHPLCKSPVNFIVVPLINMLKTINHCSPASWGKPSNTPIDFLSSGWTRTNSSESESGNGKRGSNVMAKSNVDV